MLDENWINEFLERIEQAAYNGALRAYSEVSGSPVNEKEWLAGKEAIRDYEVSNKTLWRMRVKTLDFRKDKEWKFKNGKYYYRRNALDRELVRRTKNK